MITYERRLLKVGIPLDSAISICQALRRQGNDLFLFVDDMERKTKIKPNAILEDMDAPERLRW